VFELCQLTVNTTGFGRKKNGASVIDFACRVKCLCKMSISTSTGLFFNSVPPLIPSSPYSSIKIVTSLTPLNLVDASLRKRRRRKCRAIDGSGEKQSVTVASPATESFDDDNAVDSASAVVRNFYAGINAHDVDSVQYLIADNCVYEDLVFPQPFVGRKVIYTTNQLVLLLRQVFLLMSNYLPINDFSIYTHLFL